MLEPLERNVFGCRECFDFGKVLDGKAERPCPRCGGWSAERRDEAIRQEMGQRATRPELEEKDLTPEELETVCAWKVDYPKAHPWTLLSWIEGRRYEPAKDAEFLALVKRRLGKWRFLAAGANEGCLPGRIRHALATGETDHLSDAERDRVESLRAGRRAA